MRLIFLTSCYWSGRRSLGISASLGRFEGRTHHGLNTDPPASTRKPASGNDHLRPRLPSLREPLVRVRQGAWSRQIACLQLGNLESCATDDLVTFAIDVATTCYMLPDRREPLLPKHHAS